MLRPALSEALLIWQRADGSELPFSLTADIMVVGRDADADIRVDEPLVSRAHARIEKRHSGYVVIDLGSTNLTRVNGEVVGEHDLKDGDEVRFARARCRFRLASAMTDPAAGSAV